MNRFQAIDHLAAKVRHIKERGLTGNVPMDVGAVVAVLDELRRLERLAASPLSDEKGAPNG